MMKVATLVVQLMALALMASTAFGQSVDTNDEITSTISHEWYGGAHPPTDLFAAVRVLVEGREIWEVQRVYLEGELDSSEGVTTLLPGGKKNLLIRLNWPGTGSATIEPLIKETDVGEHMLKFFLLFKSAGNNCYVETPEIKIQVESASSEKVWGRFPTCPREAAGAGWKPAPHFFIVSGRR